MKQLVLIVLVSFFVACKGQTRQKIVSSLEILEDDVLQAKSKEELRLLRNEVFARKGYVFKSEDLQEYFLSKDWYKPDSSIIISLTEKEKKYIARIKGLENTKRKISKKNTRSIDYIHKNKEKIYPINFESTEDYMFYNKIEETKVDMYKNIQIRNISCEGITYCIKCFDNIQYLLVPTAQCGNYETYLVILKNNEINVKLISGTKSTSGSSNNYHSYQFVLSEENLEIIKTHIGGKVELSKEKINYKLTENGLVER